MRRYCASGLRQQPGAAAVTEGDAACGEQFSQLHALRVSVNESLLATTWGVRHPDLTRMFGNADANRDGWTGWAMADLNCRLLPCEGSTLPLS